MSDSTNELKLNRRQFLGAVGKAATAAAITPVLSTTIVSCAMASNDAPLNAIAGVDRVTSHTGRTYLRGWTGYGDRPLLCPTADCR
jgi:hypothetical protein